jgi:hypothetical protein
MTFLVLMVYGLQNLIPFFTRSAVFMCINYVYLNDDALLKIG